MSNSQTSWKCERADGNGTRPKFAKARVRVRSPCHCTGHPWCRLHAHRPLLRVLAVILFSAAPTTCSGPRPPSPPSPALPLSHLPLWRLGMRTAHAPLHLHTRQPLASRLLAARLLVCSLVCLLARVLAHSPFLTCRPPASPPQTHDCPAVMGLRLVFASGGGSPWFNFIWSSN